MGKTKRFYNKRRKHMYRSDLDGGWWAFFHPYHWMCCNHRRCVFGKKWKLREDRHRRREARMGVRREMEEWRE
jgi:hypothetical protein